MSMPLEQVKIEMGANPQELFASTEEKILEIVHNDKKWVFKYKDLDFGGKGDCIDAAQMWVNGEFRFSLKKYYALALSKMITSGPVQPITETTLGRLNQEVGNRLITIVPPPVDMPQLEALKKA